MKTAEAHFIGIVHGDITDTATAPKNFDESDHTGVLEIYPQYRDGLDGIEAGQTIVVLFWLHQAARDTLRVYPRGDRNRPLRGVFATRSPSRPNPIAISELRVTKREDTRLEVYGLDVLDATPVLDIKKKL